MYSNNVDAKNICSVLRSGSMDNEDAALSFLQPDETFADFLSRVDIKSLPCGIPIIDHRCPLRNGTILEISGCAGTGKTEILYHIACTYILPKEENGISYGGHGANVLLYDLDCKFDAVRMAHIVQSRIFAARKAAGVSGDDGDDENTIRQRVYAAAHRLRVVSCPSSFHFLASLKVARPLLQELGKDGAGVAAVLIDNLTAHYYADRDAKGALHGEKSRRSAPLTLPRVHKAIGHDLRAIQHACRIPIIATKHVFATTADGHLPRELMTTSWQEVPTHKLFLRRDQNVNRRKLLQEENVPTQMEEEGYVATWLKPVRSLEDSFRIGDAGVMCL